MKSVLITGTSSGIGEATAQYFLKRGWRVFATARQPEKLGAWSHTEQVIPVPLDVTKPESVRSAIGDALRIAGRLDVLVNNAGVGLAGPLEAIPVEEIERHFQTNFFGSIRMIQEILPVFRRQRQGVIVNVSSVAGRFGVPFLSAYCAGKFALEGLSESLYYELLPFNIRIKLIEPGGIKTSFTQRFSRHDDYQPNLDTVETRVNQASGPASTLPGPERVAEVIFKTSTDGTERLRYPVKTQGASILQRMLPERQWRSIISKSFGITRSKAEV
ncbi:NAD(P)-dependent dehydrogenase (short-subunit alcohol dehydrogenase family) [Silvibacterium bohemicum]|uniref:NAD(P)-dependent dehydrogenase (Short-subunit alcohol dehydrogenase family) n=1 Tax=Silvibacterium bohemicum TaxID=1577686 RepID=A0A841K4F1_9BACT|nr:SDR family oxidoreductase [Silvibacterium bohemicum]MBB6146819.1 NAD(P)-dependent dehydrogenase (short-subunit alcohol dehydrogenase family) [Silvibacterium bohemicum]